MNLQISWNTIYQDIKDRFGEDLDELRLIRSANRVLDTIKSIANLKSTIRIDRIPYVYEFEKYQLASDFKDVISLRYNDKTDNARNRNFIIDEPPFIQHNTDWNFYEPNDWNGRDLIDSACIQIDKGVEKLYLANGRADQTSQLISNCDNLAEWTGSGGAGSLELDDASDKKTEGDYSIKFVLTSATAGKLTLNLATSVDLSDYTNEDVIMFDLRLPTSPASIDVKIGTDSSNYYTQNITTQADGSAFDTIRNNEVRFSFKDATLTGTPDMSVANYMEIILNFATATTDTDFHIDNIKAWQVEWLDMEYYSFYMVKTLAGVWQEKFTETLGTDEYVLIENQDREAFECGMLVESGLLDNDNRITYWKSQYDNWIKKIKKDNRKKIIPSHWW